MEKKVYALLSNDFEKGYTMLKDSHFFCFFSEIFMIVSYYLFCLSHNTFNIFYRQVAIVDDYFRFDSYASVNADIFSFKDGLSRFVSIYDSLDKTLLPVSITPLYVCNIIYNIFLNYYDSMLNNGYDTDYIENVIKSVIPSGFMEIYFNSNDDITILFNKINADISARRNSNEQND